MTFATRPFGSFLFKRHRARLAIGLTLSVIIHAFIVSLRFGIPGLGLPGLELPWNERRAQAPELSIRIANVERALSPAPNGVPNGVPNGASNGAHSREPPASARGETPAQVAPPSGARVTLPRQVSKPTAPAKHATPPPAIPPRPHPAMPRLHTPVMTSEQANPDSFALPGASPEEPEPQIMSGTGTPDQPPEVVENTVPEATPASPPEQPAAQTMEQAAQELKEEAAVISNQEMGAKEQADATASRLALETEARKQGEEAGRLQAAAVALQKQAILEEEEAAKRMRQLAAKEQDEARKQAEERARQQAAALDRQMKLEQLAAREKAQELADRQRAAALAAQQRERDRHLAESLPADAPGSAANNRAAQTARLPENLLGGLASRAIEQPRKFDLERNEPPARPAKNAESARRRSVFGSIDHDIGVTMYIEGWRQKIERNGNMNYRPSASDRAREDPVVTVSIRSDGTVEDIAIVRSSGLPELDGAVLRIVRLYARYSAFPPDLARRYDVIEIRRVWNFDDRLRIREEMR